MIFKKALIEYTETEFLALITELHDSRPDLSNAEFERLHDSIVMHLDEIVEHPDGADLIIHPPYGSDPTPEGALSRVKEWRAANGKPGFKPA